MRLWRRTAIRIGLCWVALAAYAHPALALPLIRDAEIEHTLREYATPIWRTAGLEPDSVKLFIVQDGSINAFVAGGQNLFINTGLIVAMETPDMLLGVIAHETGHIAGGHLARGAEQMRNAQIGMILSMVLGAAAGAASGKADVGVATISGGTNVLQRNMLAFSRGNEQAADQSALASLDALGISASGMLQTFELLRRHERQYRTIDPYMITHPLSSERIETVRAHVDGSKIPEGQYPKKFDAMHQRMLAKLRGFLDVPERTLARYPASDRSEPARLARAVAFHKQANLQQALGEMDGLLTAKPKDAFYHELKGQILFENGRVKEALPEYQKAVEYYPNSALLLADLGKVQIALEQYGPAVANLEKASRIDPTNGDSWRLLATAYGKQGDEGMAALALGEEALLANNPSMAMRQANVAIKALKPGIPAALRAQDVKQRAEELRKENDD